MTDLALRTTWLAFLTAMVATISSTPGVRIEVPFTDRAATWSWLVHAEPGTIAVEIVKAGVLAVSAWMLVLSIVIVVISGCDGATQTRLSGLLPRFARTFVARTAVVALAGSLAVSSTAGATDVGQPHETAVLIHLGPAVDANPESTTDTPVGSMPDPAVDGTFDDVLVTTPGESVRDATPDSVPDVAVLERLGPSPAASRSDTGASAATTSDAPSSRRLGGPDRLSPVSTDTWCVVAGDHFWSIAEATVGAHLRADPPVEAIAEYWIRLVELNVSRLPDPSNPDLIYPGFIVTLPVP